MTGSEKFQIGKRGKALGFVGLFLFAGAQVSPYPSKAGNPPAPISHSLLADPSVPAAVKDVMDRSCMNCHSSATRWPWYARIAPASWLVHHDVKNARKAVNFSNWGSKPQAVRAAIAAAACEDVRTGKMPKAAYTMMHPEARLSDGDKEAICAWSQESIRALARPRPKTASQD